MVLRLLIGQFMIAIANVASNNLKTLVKLNACFFRLNVIFIIFQVTVSRNGKTQVEVIAKLVFENFWIGPSQEDLIRLGAKYAPCMRRDKLLFRTIDAEKVIENRTGCCVQTYYTGCIQTSREDCMVS